MPGPDAPADPRRTALALAAVRTMVGTCAFVAPEHAPRLLGLPAGRREARYFAMLYGVREAALGIATVAAGEGRRRPWVATGVAVDLADLAVAAATGTAGAVPKRTAVLTAVAAVSGAAAGLWVLSRDS